MKTKPSLTQSFAALVLTFFAAPSFAQAAAPLANPSVDDIVTALSGSMSKSLRQPRPLPEAQTSLCKAKPQAGSNAMGRNLIVYADDAASRVNLALQFKVDSTELSSNDRRVLDTLAEALRRPELAKVAFAVAGHTDVSGKFQHNLRLSCGRALAAESYLIKRGIAPDRLTAYGFGSQRLLNGFDSNAPQHRRVEIRRAPDGL
jgi:outer membrane protein OmpA-like peptidoglycan-associated protein